MLYTMAERPVRPQSSPECMSKFQQLIDFFTLAIDRGDYQLGDKLPSLRSVCQTHQVSMTTAKKAFYELERLAYAEAEPRAAFRVIVAGQGRKMDALAAGEFDPLCLLENVAAPWGSPFINAGLLDTRALNRELMRAMASYPQALNHQPMLGLDQLRRQIARMYHSEGVHLHWENLIVTCGGMEALSLAIQAVVQGISKPCLAVVTPAFPGVLSLIRQLGISVIEVASEPDLDLPALGALLQEQAITALLVMPNFQHPSGRCMPEADKQALLDLAYQYQLAIIEDDTYRALHFADKAPLPLKAYDRLGLVLHCCSFSKTIAPGYRVGWIEPGRWSDRIRALKFCSSLSSPLPSQLALAALLAGDLHSRSIAKLRTELQKRTEAMRTDILACFPAGTHVEIPAGGYLLWITLPQAIDLSALLKKALAQGIHFAPGWLCYPQGGPLANQLRLNASFYSGQREVLGWLGEDMLIA